MGPFVGSKEKRRRLAKIRRKDAKINPQAEDGTKSERYVGKLEKRGVCNAGPNKVEPMAYNVRPGKTSW